MKLSYAILSHNQQDQLLRTLGRLKHVTPLPADQWEVWVADQGSTDGSADAVAKQFPDVHVLCNCRDSVTAALSLITRDCSGPYVACLDERTCPARGKSLDAALSLMDSNPRVGGVTGMTTDAGGRVEAPELPGMLLAGACILRKSMLERIDAFGRRLQPGAEFDDLSFRIWAGGYRVDCPDAVQFRREKNPGTNGTEISRPMQLGASLILARQFLPHPFRDCYCEDWQARYTALAHQHGDARATRQANGLARLRGLWQTIIGPTPLDPSAVEDIFGFQRQSNLVGDWARRNGVWRVALGDFGKNIYATYRACRCCGLQVRCVTDDHLAFVGKEYRGLPILTSHYSFKGEGIDGVVLTDLNPARVEPRIKSIRSHFNGPILNLSSHASAEHRARAAA